MYNDLKSSQYYYIVTIIKRNQYINKIHKSGVNSRLPLKIYMLYTRNERNNSKILGLASVLETKNSTKF